MASSAQNPVDEGLGDTALVDDAQEIVTPMNCGSGSPSAVVSRASVC
jgi:hypothetical protein